MTINAAQLKLALSFAADADVRYYLKGIHITPKGLEASDGYKAIVIGGNTRANDSVILSSDSAAQVLLIAKQLSKDLSHVELSFDVVKDERTGQVKITTTFIKGDVKQQELVTQGIEARYPDLGKVMSVQTSDVIDGRLPQCNWNMLGEVMKDFATYRGQLKALRSHKFDFTMTFGRGQWRYSDNKELIDIVVMGYTR